MILPSFSAILLTLALLLTASCGGERTGPAAPTAGAAAAEAANTAEPFTVVAGAGEVDPDHVERVRAMTAAELPRLRATFDGKSLRPFFVHVHADRASLPPALAAVLHPESPAFALLGAHQIHVVWGEMARLGSNLQGVVRHELVHELLDQYVAPHGRLMPRWFHEGLAQHLAGDTYLGAREDDLVVPLLARRTRSFEALKATFPTSVEELRIAYAQSYSYVSWLVREHGLRDLLAVARSADDITSFPSALAGRLGRSTLQLEDGWREYLLHGSGAPWRVVLGNCFTLSLIIVLPLLVLALRRHLAKEARTARHLVERERAAAAAAAAAAAETAAPIPSPPTPAGSNESVQSPPREPPIAQ